MFKTTRRESLSFRTVAVALGLVMLAGASTFAQPQPQPPILLIQDCGTIGPGPQGCLLFTTDAGQSYALNLTSPVLASRRLWITGTVDPLNLGCFPAQIPILDVISSGACFSECGELASGPQGCPILRYNNGGDFVFIENIGGAAYGDKIWVKGCYNRQSQICGPFTAPGVEDNRVGKCFAGCGRLVQGIECVLFKADGGGLYQLSNLGAFGPGDYVYVEGCVNPLCASFCFPPDGCIQDNTIERCCTCPDDRNDDALTPGSDGKADPGVKRCPPCGACCLDIDDGPIQYDTCRITTRARCEAAGGVFQGNYTVCKSEACCLPSGFCQDVDPRCCEASGGRPQGPNSTCANSLCPPLGACCNLEFSVTCHEVTREECEEQGGTFLGAGTQCRGHSACCLPDGSCLLIDIVCCEAIGGTPGPNFSAGCGGEGACCLDIDDGPLQYDTCRVMDRVCCEQQGGVFEGVGSVCTREACCLPGGGCQETDPECCEASGGRPQGPNSTCESNICQIGACCTLDTNVTCHLFTAAECEEFGGNFLGVGTQCLGHAACCLPDDSCAFIDIACCLAEGGTPAQIDIGSCVGEGACCFDIDDGPLQYDTCRVLDRVCCNEQGGEFMGVGTTCDIQACCLPSGYCQDTDARCCEASGGRPAGPGTSCSTTLCP